MVKIEKGYDAEEVKRNIRVAMDGLQIIETTEMIRSIEDNIGQIYLFMKVVLCILVLISVITLSIVFWRDDF